MYLCLHPPPAPAIVPTSIWTHFLQGEPACASIVPETHTNTHDLQVSIQLLHSISPFLLRAKSGIFPDRWGRRAASRAVQCQKERSCCNSPVTHSQTHRFCRPESHFLLGEVSHCNKTRRGSQVGANEPCQPILFSVQLEVRSRIKGCFILVVFTTERPPITTINISAAYNAYWTKLIAAVDLSVIANKLVQIQTRAT